MPERERSPLPRRGFLSGLAALPLIGGGVSLIGQPTAAAVPVTKHLLRTYEQWLGWERLKACNALYGFDRATKAQSSFVPSGAAYDWHFPGGRIWELRSGEAASRAAVMLSAAGVPLREGFDHG